MDAVDQPLTWRRAAMHRQRLHRAKRQASTPTSTPTPRLSSSLSPTKTPPPSSSSSSSSSPSSQRPKTTGTPPTSRVSAPSATSKTNRPFFGPPVRTETAAGVSGTSIWEFPGQRLEVAPWTAIPVSVVILTFIVLTLMHLCHAQRARSHYRRQVKAQQADLIASLGTLSKTGDVSDATHDWDVKLQPLPYNVPPPASPIIDVTIPRCKISFDLRRNDRSSVVAEASSRPFDRRPRGSVVVAADEFGQYRARSSIHQGTNTGFQRHSRGRSSVSDRLSAFLPALPNPRKQVAFGKPSRLRFDIDEGSSRPCRGEHAVAMQDIETLPPETVKSALSPTFSSTRFRDNIHVVRSPPTPPHSTTKSSFPGFDEDVGDQWALYADGPVPSYTSPIPSFKLQPAPSNPYGGLDYGDNNVAEAGQDIAEAGGIKFSITPSRSLMRRPTLQTTAALMARTPSGKRIPGSSVPGLQRQNTTCRSPMGGTMASGGTRDSSFHPDPNDY